ncbi:hypothetical protein PG985_009994 [Apiospora marii]|uniref:Mid2 domain-containing protein n=1 Tax=Apiospora marii TaxID=335849 RepID=A0ABR1RKX6_9PEZI
MGLERSVICWKSTVTALFATVAQAGDFLTPWHAGPNKDYSNNLRVVVGTTASLAWQMNSGEGLPVEIRLWQDSYPGVNYSNFYAVLERSHQGSEYTWTVSYSDLDPKFHDVYYLEVTNGEDEATTHYFNITDKEASKSNSASMSATISASPAAPTATVWQTVTAESNAGEKPLATGTWIGIIVGVVAALLLLLVGMWWAIRVWKKKKTKDLHPVIGSVGDGGGGVGNGNQRAYGAEVGGNAVSEAEAKAYVSPVYEVDGRQMQRR